MEANTRPAPSSLEPCFSIDLVHHDLYIKASVTLVIVTAECEAPIIANITASLALFTFAGALSKACSSTASTKYDLIHSCDEFMAGKHRETS